MKKFTIAIIVLSLLVFTVFFINALNSNDDLNDDLFSTEPDDNNSTPAGNDEEAPNVTSTTGNGDTSNDQPTSDGAADPDLSESDAAALRCQANQDAGRVTFVTGFDFAASAGIIDAIVADAQGYFDELCIDFDIQPGFSPANGALVLAGKADFGVAGSFAELVNNNIAGSGDLVAVLHWGRTAINAVVLPEDSTIEDFAGLCGHLIGVKGDIPYSLQTAIALAGIERSCFDEITLSGFDPVAHLALGIDALPVYKSNEPYTLTKEGVNFTMLDPLQFDVPASFGITFTRQSFIDEHPELAQDVIRALIRGQAFAAANPEIALENAFELIDAVGNPRYLALAAETHRWAVESELIASSVPEDVGLGIPDLPLLEAEIEALTEVGVFDQLPDWRSMVDADITASVYEGSTLVWP
ncbi:MAG: ABC transporter substrate-binding protein [Acidimicrobiaceae bacterium]|nr:ABC transporter substrate-binding protein [Acidimicrobiaceae bacterium]